MITVIIIHDLLFFPLYVLTLCCSPQETGPYVISQGRGMINFLNFKEGVCRLSFVGFLLAFGSDLDKALSMVSRRF